MATIENNSILNNLSLSAIASQYAQGISNYNSQQQIAQQYMQQMAMQQSQYIRQPSGGYSMGASVGIAPQPAAVSSGIFHGTPIASGISKISDASKYISKETLTTLVLDTNATESIKNWWIQGSIGTSENTMVEPVFSTTVANIPTKSEEVNPLKCFYAEDGKSLNWKAIHEVVEGKVASTLTASLIAEALVQAKECGFRESSKR